MTPAPPPSIPVPIPNDPIVAVSSPPGRGLRGILRTTADGLHPILDDLLDPTPSPRRLTACRLSIPPEAHGSQSMGFSQSVGFSLPCLALFHPGPRSFTGQDVLEIQVPGSPALLERVLHTLLTGLRDRIGGGRLAEPGEFTRRAFTAGRIDLTRAEGVAATIGAVSDAQLEAARLLRTGRLGSWATRLVDQLAQLLALVEAGIDFIDQDDVTPITPDALEDGLSAIEGELDHMLHRSRSWSALEALPWVVLVGPPNAGKSTLFNALLGRDRAVTSGLPGTTRDVLAEPLRIDADPGTAAEVMLVDVAGLDPSKPDDEPSESSGSADPSPLDHAMQTAARDAIDRAELVLLLSGDESPAEPIDREDVPTLRLLAKADLRPPGGRDEPHGLRISAVTGEGMDELRRRIADAMRDRAVTLAGQMLTLQPRHRNELRAALEAVADARTLLTGQRGNRSLIDMELIAGEMRRTLDHLGALGGQMTPDDVIGKVFSTFCIGK